LDARNGGILASLFDEEGSYSYEGNHILGFGYGVGVDLGFQYQVDENWKVSASGRDLGGSINWQNDYGRTISLTGDGEITFDGFDATLNADNLQDDLEDQFDELEDELKNDFQLTRTTGSYSSTIGSQFLVSAHYQTNNKKHQAIGLLHTRNRFGDQFYQAGLTYHYSPTRWLQLSTGYSWMKEAPANLGGGITFALGAIQFNAFSNHVPGLFNIGAAGQASARGGINVVWRFDKAPPKVEIEEKVEETKKYF